MKRKFCSLILIVMAFSASADFSGQIVRVLDGDTVEMLEPGNQLTRIRLAGIDAPEKSQSFGQRSRQEGVRLENGIYGHSRFCNTDFDDKLACLNLSGV